MVLFITSVLIKSYSVSFEIKAIEQYFPVAILIAEQGGSNYSELKRI